MKRILKKAAKLAARTKEGMGLDIWAKSLYDRGLIPFYVYDDFIRQNNAKEAAMTALGLPQLLHYGFYASLEEIAEIVPKRAVKNDRLIIRCRNKETGKIKRLLDTLLGGAISFAKKLPGGFEAWKVEVKEFTKTFCAGTIIVESSGKAFVETWRGSHYRNVIEGVPKLHGAYDPETNRGFQWKRSGNLHYKSDLQRGAIQALKYVYPHLRFRKDEPIYLEYGIRPNGMVYFIEASTSPLLTGGVSFN